MNAKSVSSAVKAAVSADASSPQAGADAIVAAANLLLADLARGVAIEARALRAAMIASFGASDAEGAWDWKAAYEACEAAQILFLRKFGQAMRDRAASPLRFLAMVTKLAALVPSYTWRSEESRASQQFSTPIALGFVARTAAAITPADLVLEPSAGTGLLAIHAELAGARLVLNEIADSRAGLLERLFPGAGVTRYDADHIHDHLDAGIRPSVVLMNPPLTPTAALPMPPCATYRRSWRSSPTAAAWSPSPARTSPPTIHPGAMASSACRNVAVWCFRPASTAASMPATVRSSRPACT
jgi:hypothetical protein